MLNKLKSLFTSPQQKEEPMTATATRPTTQTPTTGKTCSVSGSKEQLSATSECSGDTTLCQDAVRERAYLLWEKAGYPNGNDGVSFWLQAETELRAETAE